MTFSGSCIKICGVGIQGNKMEIRDSFVTIHFSEKIQKHLIIALSEKFERAPLASYKEKTFNDIVFFWDLSATGFEKIEFLLAKHENLEIVNLNFRPKIIEMPKEFKLKMA